MSQVATTVQTARPSKEGSKLTFFDKMASTAYKMFGNQGKKFAASSPQMRDEILKSNLRITPEALVSLALFTTVLSIIPVAICVVLGLVLHIIFLFMVVVAPPIVFVIVWNAAKDLSVRSLGGLGERTADADRLLGRPLRWRSLSDLHAEENFRHGEGLPRLGKGG